MTDGNVSLVNLIQRQLDLQIVKMADGDPRDLSPEARAQFLTWNAFALTDEIHEAMQEVGWKPWATDRSVNREAFVREMVDAFHFFMNMLLAVSPGMTAYAIAEEFTRFYAEKNAKNAQRQDEGYTGREKCSQCHRELDTNLERDHG